MLYICIYELCFFLFCLICVCQNIVCSSLVEEIKNIINKQSCQNSHNISDIRRYFIVNERDLIELICCLLSYIMGSSVNWFSIKFWSIKRKKNIHKYLNLFLCLKAPLYTKTV